MPVQEIHIILPQISHMKKISILFLILIAASCKNTKQATTAPLDKFIIEDLAEMDSDEIKKSYPEANITEDIGEFEEGTERRPYTILFPDTENEIQITWNDKERSKINDIRFSEDGKWKSSTGIEIGTSLEELNRLNGKPVSFYGFGWDYSGAVVFNNGKFKDSNLRVFLASDKSFPEKFYGDQIIKASPEEIAALDLKVQTLIYKK